MDLLHTLIIFFGILNLTFGVFLYINSKQSFVVKLYAWIIIFATLWTLSTLLTNPTLLSAPYFRYALYGHYIFGYLAYLSFFWFALFYPEPSRRSKLVGITVTALTSLYLIAIPITGVLVHQIQPGATLSESIQFNVPGYIAFILMLSAVFFAGLLVLLRTRKSFVAGALYKDLDRYQIYFAILANFIAGTLGIVFNLIFPLYGNFSFFYINPILVTGALIVVGLYNILRYNLFNSRLILSEFFTGGILILSLTRLILSEPGTARIIDGILLVVMGAFGAFLIQSILRETKQRELIEKQEEELRVANQQQESLLHFISHEIKGYLTKNEAAFASIIAGDFGQPPPEIDKMADLALKDTRSGVATVMDILDASNLKHGTIEFKKTPFNLVKAVDEVVDDLASVAAHKGLQLTFTKPVTGPCMIAGDEEKIRRHVIRNIIDNSIKYTPSGSVKVDLIRAENIARVIVSDTGVGITSEDMGRLFTEGGHGKDSIKVNVHSTGYGLFIAKQIIAAHGGKIWAESDGAGTGSRFIMEFPVQP
ncbi:HAMP domain-containing histidine kinase [Candidatus Kaiserbacteria bacterium]|nr:HAMP domain-containing histidine kinase [Candidatus Kaiserbacteria bacterium]